MKEYEITFKFSDIIQTIEAESLEEATKQADELLEGDQTPHNDTQCYDVEIEEVN